MSERSRQIEHDAAAWLARRDGAGWSAADARALDAWLAASTAHKVEFLRLEAAWLQSGRLKALGAGLAAGELPDRGRWTQNLFDLRATPAADDAVDATALDGPLPQTARTVAGTRTRALPVRRSGRAWLAASAVAVAAISLAWAWQRHEHVAPLAYRTAIGDLRSIALADGSAATLSSDSAIDVALSSRERHIDLTRGEAYFDVAKDAARPFAVQAGDSRIVAVGTRFAVRRDGDDVRVVVTEGTVRLESTPVDGRSQPVTLLPAGSTALANRSGVLVRTGSAIDAERALDWRRGYLVFLDTPLAVAVAEFNRYNTRPLVIGDATAAQLRVGGSFRWSNAEVFANLLEQALPVRAEREADRIVLYSR
jgi:transmembrane sensor